MGRARLPLQLSLVLCATLAFVGVAQAQGLVRYVSSAGSDANPCTRTLPCLSLQAAVNAAPNGGQVQVLDSGLYPPTTVINKSITISAIGVNATIVNANAGSIAIRIDAPGQSIVLRGLRLDGLGFGGNGISVENAAAVHIEDCEVEGFGVGIQSFTSGVKLRFADITARDNRGYGIVVGGANSTLMVEDSYLENNDVGLGVSVTDSTVIRTVASAGRHSGILLTGGRMTAAKVTAVQTQDVGFWVDDAQLTLERSVARGSTFGLFMNDGTVHLSNSVITNNATGIRMGGAGGVQTRQNSIVRGNTVEIVGGGAVVPLPPV